MADRSTSQLERVLYILPVAARQDGVLLVELARALDVEEKSVLIDLEQAMTRVYYHPAGWVENFTISIEHDRVSVHAPSEFQRPVRLNEPETLALGLGLRMLAAEAEATRRAEILAFAERLERELQTPAHDLQPRIRDELAVPPRTLAAPMSIQLELEPDDYRGDLADAIAQQRVCTIWYVKPGAREPAERRVAPLYLVYSSGQWYLWAHDQERNDRRLFRLDRVLSVRSEEATFDRTASADSTAGLMERGFAFENQAGSETEVRVRYSPRIARWLAEHVQASCEADGSLVLTHRVADPEWLIRHVLQYGEDAEVLEPREARELVSTRALCLAG
jgi:predicted DNA-binding transcriptional regulator YafY